jgi:hypothetical protein
MNATTIKNPTFFALTAKPLNFSDRMFLPPLRGQASIIGSTPDVPRYLRPMPLRVGELNLLKGHSRYFSNAEFLSHHTGGPRLMRRQLGMLVQVQIQSLSVRKNRLHLAFQGSVLSRSACSRKKKEHRRSDLVGNHSREKLVWAKPSSVRLTNSAVNFWLSRQISSVAEDTGCAGIRAYSSSVIPILSHC